MYHFIHLSNAITSKSSNAVSSTLPLSNFIYLTLSNAVSSTLNNAISLALNNSVYIQHEAMQYLQHCTIADVADGCGYSHHLADPADPADHVFRKNRKISSSPPETQNSGCCGWLRI